LWFYRDAIEACISVAQWDLGARYAAALEAFTLDEPLPWASLIVARFRALQDLARDPQGGHALERLEHVKTQVRVAGLGWALNALDKA
jgi:hypothetical protein